MEHAHYKGHCAQQSGYEKNWYLVWSQASWLMKLGDKTTSTLESCVVMEGLKGKGGQGMETCLKQQ